MYEFLKNITVLPEKPWNLQILQKKQGFSIASVAHKFKSAPIQPWSHFIPTAVFEALQYVA